MAWGYEVMEWQIIQVRACALLTMDGYMCLNTKLYAYQNNGYFKMDA